MPTSLPSVSSSITVDSLKLYGRHGVDPRERSVGNLFEVTVTVKIDVTKAAETDDVSFTLNYAELTQIIKEEMRRPRNLIETVAHSIFKRIVERWPESEGGSVTIVKLHPPIPAPTPRASVTLNW